MPKFECSYAYDISHYFDVVVESKDRDEAQKKLDEALKKNQFAYCTGQPDDTTCNERAWVQDEITDGITDGMDTLEDVIQEAQKLGGAK